MNAAILIISCIIAREKSRATDGGEDDDLRKAILSFDLSRSTPMDAMNFIDRLQKQIGGQNG